MWTWLMVRVWAIIHEKEYRKRFLKYVAVFAVSLIAFISVSVIAQGKQLSFGAFFFSGIAYTFAGYLILW